jgi:GT2 family glycosyltransferase
MKISVMITTLNRLSDLQQTLKVLERLDPPPAEILITADGCTDNTVVYVQKNFPTARLIINETGRGSVASRDAMLRQAVGDLVLSLDDDSYPEQPDCLQRIVGLFAERPKLAVANFPQRTDEYPETLAKTDFGAPCVTRTFANSAACFRKSIYLQLPGFEASFFHMYEEPDYALQCFANGYEVYFAPIITIRHHYSKLSRNGIRVHQRHARNEMWSTLMRCPFPYAAALICYRIFSQFRFASKQGLEWVIKEPVWWWQALKGVPYSLSKAKPYSWASYKQWLSLPVKM